MKSERERNPPNKKKTRQMPSFFGLVAVLLIGALLSSPFGSCLDVDREPEASTELAEEGGPGSELTDEEIERLGEYVRQGPSALHLNPDIGLGECLSLVECEKWDSALGGWGGKCMKRNPMKGVKTSAHSFEEIVARNNRTDSEYVTTLRGLMGLGQSAHFLNKQHGFHSAMHAIDVLRLSGLEIPKINVFKTTAIGEAKKDIISLAGGYGVQVDTLAPLLEMITNHFIHCFYEGKDKLKTPGYVYLGDWIGRTYHGHDLIFIVWLKDKSLYMVFPDEPLQPLALGILSDEAMKEKYKSAYDIIEKSIEYGDKRVGDGLLKAIKWMKNSLDVYELNNIEPHCAQSGDCYGTVVDEEGGRRGLELDSVFLMDDKTILSRILEETTLSDIEGTDNLKPLDISPDNDDGK